MTQTKQTTGLPAGHRLDTYTIVRELSQGGFSRVYLALDDADRKLAIKEYLPGSMARHNADLQVEVISELDAEPFRVGKKCFFEEARVLADIQHPNVVRVRNFFAANQTVYMVMDYTEGRPLSREIELAGGALEEGRLRRLFVELVGGLREVHRRHLLHLDLKPANIYLRRNGSPVLLDFGAARQNAQRQQGQAVSMYTPAFAPPEQTRADARLGPWTDIYSLGACLYACLGIGAPPPAKQRAADGVLPALPQAASRYSPELLELTRRCMALEVERRPGSLLEVQKALQAPFSPPAKPGGLLQRLGGWLRPERVKERG